MNGQSFKEIADEMTDEEIRVRFTCLARLLDEGEAPDLLTYVTLFANG